MNSEKIKLLQTKIKMLQGARRRIRTGHTRFVCYAITNERESMLLKNWELAGQASHDLKRYIEKVLGLSAYLDGWIARKRPKINKTFKNRPQDQVQTRMRAIRIQWIDWMIDCLKEDLQQLRAKKKG
jgi:hypothetical protein